MFFRSRVCLNVLTILLVCCFSAFGTSFHTGPVTSGLSSWITIPPHRDAFTAYNKLSFDCYFSYGKLKGFLGVPVQCIVDKKDSVKVNGVKMPVDTLLQGAFLGDLSAYIGFRIGNFEPRIAIVTPLGYSTKSGVWLGSKNIILKFGSGFSGDVYKRLKMRYGGEVYFSYYVAGFPEIKDSQGKSGSYSLEPDLKVTCQTKKKWTLGVEVLGGFKKFYPIWLKYSSDQGYELSTSVVPHIIATYDAISSKFYFSGKAGFGPQFKSKMDKYSPDQSWKHTGYALNLGIGMGFYP